MERKCEWIEYHFLPKTTTSWVFKNVFIYRQQQQWQQQQPKNDQNNCVFVWVCVCVGTDWLHFSMQD